MTRQKGSRAQDEHERECRLARGWERYRLRLERGDGRPAEQGATPAGRCCRGVSGQAGAHATGSSNLFGCLATIVRLGARRLRGERHHRGSGHEIGTGHRAILQARRRGAATTAAAAAAAAASAASAANDHSYRGLQEPAALPPAQVSLRSQRLVGPFFGAPSGEERVKVREIFLCFYFCSLYLYLCAFLLHAWSVG